MVKLKYSALYTDNLGCERAELYFSQYGFQLKVRNCIFENNDFNFEFCVDGSKKNDHLFKLKDNELIEYSIDVKIPILLTCNNQELIEEFILRIEREKNNYNNSLCFYLKDKIFRVEAYNLRGLLEKMKMKLPENYNLESNFSVLYKAYHRDFNVENYFEMLGNLKNGLSNLNFKQSYLKLYNNRNDFEKLKKVPITYICKEYYSS